MEEPIRNITLPLLREFVDYNEADEKAPYVKNGFALIESVSQGIKQQLLSLGPVRLDEMRLIIFKRGWARPVVNLIEECFAAGDMVFMHEGTLFHVQEASDDIDLEGIVVGHDMLMGIFEGYLPRLFCGSHSLLVMRPTRFETAFMEEQLRLVAQLVRQEKFNPHVLNHLVAALLHYADGLFQEQDDEDERFISREQKLFGEYLSLVNRHATRQHNIDFYADSLCLSPRYLGTLIKKISGMTAKEWIDRSIVTSIKVELLHSSKSVKQISDEMDFPNTSFFCKYFKRLTGMTPLEYKSGQIAVLP